MLVLIQTCNLSRLAAYLLQSAVVAKRAYSNSQQIHGTQRFDDNSQGLQSFYTGHARYCFAGVRQSWIKNDREKFSRSFSLAFPGGIEPPTPDLGGRCSIPWATETYFDKFFWKSIPTFTLPLKTAFFWYFLCVLCNILRLVCYLRRGPLYPFNYGSEETLLF